MGLTHHQLEVLTVVERTASVLSVIGIATIIATFSFSPKFRNPIHRIVFINSFYNIFDVTATFISLSGPAAGNRSRLCQFQGFLWQMYSLQTFGVGHARTDEKLNRFPLADVLWTLAMSIDVFLIVFYKYDTEDLHKLEIKYIAIITTLVFIPACAFLFIHNPERGPVYGSVTVTPFYLSIYTKTYNNWQLWCSISPKWVIFRIVFFYGPIWYVLRVSTSHLDI
jgi:hypothetical protein